MIPHVKGKIMVNKFRGALETTACTREILGTDLGTRWKCEQSIETL